MSINWNYKIRRAHRYLGLILGVQFLLWTIGGLYFTWSDMDEIHGDHQKAHVHPLSSDIDLANPQIAIDSLKKIDSVNYILDVRLIQILSEPFYQITYSNQHTGPKKVRLADAKTCQIRAIISEEEAVAMAKKGFADGADVKSVAFITDTDAHHEYREQPLPAYAVTFDHASNTTVYVAAELGTIQKFRNDKWRLFDFLWMMHTMDYKERDNIGNWVLRAFSILGLCTILSGFVLFFITMKSRSRALGDKPL